MPQPGHFTDDSISERRIASGIRSILSLAGPPAPYVAPDDL